MVVITGVSKRPGVFKGKQRMPSVTSALKQNVCCGKVKIEGIISGE